MKKIILLTSMLVVYSAPAQMFSEFWNSGFGNGGNVTDGSLAGWSDTRTLSGYTGGGVGNLSVVLNMSGGFNGDLYAYLEHGSGFVVLLNRMGVGVTSPLDGLGTSASGMTVMFSDSGSSGDIHLYTGAGLLSGDWQADGRDISPLSSPALLESAARQNGGNALTDFNNLDPNGDWTLFVADVSSGGGTSQIASWGINFTIEAVPEPSSLALAGAGAAALLWTIRRRKKS